LILLLCRLSIVFAARLLLEDPPLPLLLSLGFLSAIRIAVPLHGISLISLLRQLFIVLLLACCSIPCCFLHFRFLPACQDDGFCLILLVHRLLIILPLACFSIRHCLCCSALLFSPPFSLLFQFTAPDFI
jgi:hypothetical protein